ncbi:FHA domain-containing protein, partial [Cellulomonas sp. APG4]|uniref:FHA domain-containing protein n=1 Tax=Cellulomonas sp. APG4 TaxID=1538656 RepID=UPI001ED919E9
PPLPAPAPSAPVPSPWSPVQRPAAADPTEMTVAREPRKEVPTAGPGPRSGIEVPAPVPAHDDDHDGLTVHSSDVVALRRQLPEWAGDAVPGPLAVPAAEQGPPAKILMSSGLVVALNRPVLIGRAPQVSRVTNSRLPRLVTVSSPNQDISRTHAEVRQEGEDVVVTDLRSTNGVLLLRQGAGPQRLHPGEPTVVEPGVVVDLGEGVTFVVERGA